MRCVTRALVVGGAGFFGSWLVDVLRGEGMRVLVVDTGLQSSTESGIAADVRNIDLVPELDDAEVDAVFQLAGTGTVPESLADPVGDLERNVATTIAVLEAARRARRPPVVCVVSSAAVYGEGRTLPMSEDHPLDPVSPYGLSKLAAESYARLYTRLYGVPTLLIRPFSLYGPRQRKLVVHDLLVRALSGEQPLRVAGVADLSRDFVFVEDAAHALVTLARSAPAEGEAYNIASGVETTLAELVETVLRAADAGSEFEFTGTVRPGDPMRWVGDPRRAATLGAVCPTPLEVGLRGTARWLRNTGGTHPPSTESI